MVQYARTDTHYLLYIYDCVRAQLLDFNHGQPGLLKSVWDRSRDISLKVRTNLPKHSGIENQPSSCFHCTHFSSHASSCFILFPLCPLPPAVQKYMKPIFTEESYLELQRKQKKSFNTQQLAAFRLLFAWRDKLARQKDESTG